MSKNKSLLEQYDVPLPLAPEDYNLIGVDFGDGMISAAMAKWTGLSRYSLIALEVGVGQDCAVNAFLHGPEIAKMAQSARSGAADPAGSVRFYNYKKCPGALQAKSMFRLDSKEDVYFVRDNEKTTYCTRKAGSYYRTVDKQVCKGQFEIEHMTYERAMAEGFNIVVNTLMQNNQGDHAIDPDKPTILLVGCPSGREWDARRYQQLLGDRLELPAPYTKPYIAVQKESTAAYARQTDPARGEERVKRDEIVVILDNGSSTFDITVAAGDRGIPTGGEDSYRFGGNLLDEALVGLMQQKIEAEHEGKQPLSRHGYKLDLRRLKEEHYGPNGTERKPVTLRIALAPKDGSAPTPGDQCVFTVDEECMRTALEKVKVRTWHMRKRADSVFIDETRVHESWLSACRGIYTAFYEQTKPFFVRQNAEGRAVPDRVILTGGVSVMPEVQAVVEEVFGVKPSLAEHANYCVSEGLAYMLATEVRKTQLLREIMQLLDDRLPDGASLQSCIVDSCVATQWKSFIKTMSQWSGDNEERSIADWATGYTRTVGADYYGPAIQEGAEKWYNEQKVREIVADLLKQKFTQLFPDYTDSFAYALADIDLTALSEHKIEIKPPLVFLFGEMVSEESRWSFLSTKSLQRKRSKKWRQEAFCHILNKKEALRSGGDTSYAYTVDFFLFKLNGTNTVTTEGLKKDFVDVFTEKVIDGMRAQILELLRPAMEEFVEHITPYFNMTAEPERQKKG